MDDLKSQLEAWAEKTAAAYHNLATNPAHPECNLAFYTQSDLTAIKNRPLNSIEDQPKLLILAINPADRDDTKYNYKGESPDDGQGQIQNTKIWNLSEGRMTKEQFLKGNPDYSNRNKKWHLWRRLRSILSKGKCEKLLDDKESVVYTNIIYFATKKADQIPAAAWELQKHAINLIKLLKPKRILCLSIPLCFDKLPLDKGSKKVLIPGKLAFGLMDNIPVYGIPHTSSRYTAAEMELVGACLGYLFSLDHPEFVTAETIAEKFADKIETFNSKQPIIKQSHIDFEELKERLVQRFGEPYEEKPKVVRYNFAGNVQLTATTQEGGYFGIGANPMTKELPDKDKYRSLLNAYGWNGSKSEVWYECKRFRSFDSIDCIIEELEQIQKEWIKL